VDGGLARILRLEEALHGQDGRRVSGMLRTWKKVWV
jgi:hypothetical protein